MKDKKQIFIFIFISLVLFSIFILLFNMLTNNEIPYKLNNKISKSNLNEDTFTTFNLESKKDDNVLLLFENNNGIKKIIEPNGLQVFANENKKIGLDYKVEKNKKYTFETTDMLEHVSNDSFITPEAHISVSFNKETKTDIDIDKVEEEIKKRLDDRKISALYANIETGEAINEDTNLTNASEIFNKWSKYPSLSTVGSANYNANWSLSGNSIRTNADVSWTGYWNKGNSDLDTDIKISFDSYSADNQWGDPIGFTFRMTEPSTNVFSFYAIELDHQYDKITLARIDNWSPATQNMGLHCGPLYDMALHNCSGQILSSVSYNLLTSTWLNTKIEIEDNTIRIYMGDTKVIEVTETDDKMLKAGGYGPWVASNPYAYFTNVSISTQKPKELLDVLEDTTWENNLPNFIINVNDNQELALDNQETCDAFNNNNIYYIAISSEENKNDINEFINKIHGGIFINSADNLEDKYEQIVNYIEPIIRSNDYN